MLSLLAGDPGLGKTTLSIDLIARCTAGLAWPDGAPASPGADVIWLTCEDPLAEVLIPRVHAAGADPSRIHVLDIMPDGKRPNLRQHAAELRQLIEKEAPALFVIDPLNAYLGGVKTYEDSAIRAALEPLVAGAAKSGTSILALMHLTKDDSRRLLYRVQGSIGYVGVARAVFCAEETDRPPLCRFRRLKANLAPRSLPNLLYRTEPDQNGILRIVWEGVEVDPPPEDPLPWQYAPHASDIEDFLRTFLAGGPVNAKVIMDAAVAEHFNPWVVRLAKQRMGIVVERKGGVGTAGYWLWRLP